MSELDLSATSAPVATNPATAPTAGALVLAPPQPVVVVAPEAAADAVPIEDAKQAELRSRATAFVSDLTAIDTRSPAFSEKIASITSMGDREMRSSAAVSNRMLERPAAALGTR